MAYIKLEKPPEVGQKRPYREQYLFDPSAGCMPLLMGVKLILDDNLPKPWQFPYDKFIQYGPEDEWWARKWGFGKEVDGPVCIRYKDKYICNTLFLEALMPKANNATMHCPLKNEIEIECEFANVNRNAAEQLIRKYTHA